MKTTKIRATDLRPGDVVADPTGATLTVASVDACAAFLIVDFTDGTATPPLALGTLVERVDTPTAPPPGSWAETARMMAGIDPDMDWDAWKDEMKEID